MSNPTARDMIFSEAFGSTGLVMAARVGEDPGEERIAVVQAALAEFYQISRQSTAVERDMALALFLIGHQCEHHYRNWRDQGRPLRASLFEQDLPRLSAAVESILEGRWHSEAEIES